AGHSSRVALDAPSAAGVWALDAWAQWARSDLGFAHFARRDLQTARLPLKEAPRKSSPFSFPPCRTWRWTPVITPSTRASIPTGLIFWRLRLGMAGRRPSRLPLGKGARSVPWYKSCIYNTTFPQGFWVR